MSRIDRQDSNGELRNLPGWSQACGALTALAQHLGPELEHAGSLPPTEQDRSSAWELYAELSTRISVDFLPYRDGDETVALDSLYKLFLRARELVVEHGRSTPAFTALASPVLESIVRPFTGHWHGRKLRGDLDRQDERRRFRRELRRLRNQLAAFGEVLAVLAARTRLYTPRGDSRAQLDLESLWPDFFIGPTSTRGEAPSIAAEQDQIVARRERAYTDAEEQKFGGLGASADDKPKSLGFVGLALSGGGIRSATFCLGVLQCLQRHHVLRDVDYLSTVSGGGYLGAFLSTRLWAQSKTGGPSPSYDVVLDNLLIQPHSRTGDTRAVRWLRNNSKYLLNRTWKKRWQTLKQYAKGLFPWGPSLHSFYRDRLSEAYITDGSKEGIAAPLLSELAQSASGAPYHLFNAAVNLPASREIELRGRRSDFFLLSPLWTGSVVTGYCSTQAVEDLLKDRGETCDLATAMAISGAAVSPHMGMRNLGFFTRTALVAVNARLSYWLPNPGKVAAKKAPSGFRPMGSRWRELRGNFAEDDAFVNLSDGGHVENLGVYELLRRRCKLIIAVDGECDPSRGCGALIKVSRLAAIDLGVRIRLELSNLGIDQQALSQTHWAFGTIHYADGELGYLVYIKSSLTGNEPDYVKQYQREHPAFPHQTTADQLFNEEQFEAYRALGEHAAEDLFGDDLITAEELKSKPFRARRWLESLVRELL